VLWSASFTATLITATPSCASLRISFWKKYVHNQITTKPPALIGYNQVSKPFFTTLQKWIFSGELYDPCDEFFVAMDPELAHYQYIHPKAISGQTSTDVGFPNILGDLDEGSSEGDPRSRLWEAKYQFRKEMLPSFLGEAFGKKVSGLCFSLMVGASSDVTIDFLDWKELELHQIQLWGLRLGYHAPKVEHHERRYGSTH